MTVESAILRAYALLSQGAYDESEQMLKNTDGALNTPSGADLFARICFERGNIDEAKQIWKQIHSLFPDFEPAVNALKAYENQSEDFGRCSDYSDIDNSRKLPFQKKICIASLSALILGVLFSLLINFVRYGDSACRTELDPIVFTNIITRVETNYVDREIFNVITNTVFVDRIITNVVEIPVEHSAPIVQTQSLPSATTDEQNQHLFRYKIKPGDNLTKIANKCRCEVQEIINLNADVDPNLIKVGETLFLPVDIRQENNP